MSLDGGDLLTVAQLAQYLGVSAEQIYRWWLNGQGPEPVPGNGMPRWERRTVEFWVSGGGLERSA